MNFVFQRIVMVNAQGMLSAEMEDVNVFLALPWDPITNVTRVSFFFLAFHADIKWRKKWMQNLFH